MTSADPPTTMGAVFNPRDYFIYGDISWSTALVNEATTRATNDADLGAQIDSLKSWTTVSLAEGNNAAVLENTVFECSVLGTTPVVIQLPQVTSQPPNTYIVYRVINTSSFGVTVVKDPSDGDMWDFWSFTNLGLGTVICPVGWRSFEVVLMKNTWFIRPPPIVNFGLVLITANMQFSRYSLPMTMQHPAGALAYTISLPALSTKDVGRFFTVVKRAGGALRLQTDGITVSMLDANGSSGIFVDLPAAVNSSYMVVWNGATSAGFWVVSDNSA